MGKLLTKARKAPRRRRARRERATRDELELAIALVKGEITFRQCITALDMKPQNLGSAMQFAWSALRSGVQYEDVILELKDEEK